MTELSIQLPDIESESEDFSVPELSRLVLMNAGIQLYREKKLSPAQASELAGLPLRRFLLQVEEAPPPAHDQSLEGSRYLLRVLWALHEGEKRSITPMTAAELAKFVSGHSEIKIEETNTARFFRDCRKSGKFENYWTVCEQQSRRRYSISEKGKAGLLTWLEGSDGSLTQS